MEAPLLIESIRLEDGVFQLLDYHWARMQRSCQALNIDLKSYDLIAYLNGFNPPSEGLYKCRILYDTRIKKVHFQRYFPKRIQSVQVVYADNISYPIKTLERNALDKLYRLRKCYDDILIVRNGFFTDSFYGNLLFLQDGRWYTPESNLLSGVQRAVLLDEGRIHERQIHVSELGKYEKVRIINSMLDIEKGPEIDLLDVHLF